MTSKLQAEYDIRRYNNLKYNINNIIPNLSSAISNIDLLNVELKDKYRVNDDSSIILSRTNELRNNLSIMVKTLNNNVLPAIDKAIADLKKKK